jgi:hypothetical protein
MKTVTAEFIEDILYNLENGFLIKFHLHKGLDLTQLDKLYEILEILKNEWKTQDNIPKNVIFQLIAIVPALYRDLPMYAEKEEFYGYEEIVYGLDSAITMCLNPNINDPFFNKPLKELGF